MYNAYLHHSLQVQTKLYRQFEFPTKSIKKQTSYDVFPENFEALQHYIFLEIFWYWIF